MAEQKARPENAALERHWWTATRALGPTGMAAHLGASIKVVLGAEWQGISQVHAIDEQCAELSQQAKRAYEVIRNRAQARYASQGTTSARIRTIKAFARGEPLLVYERWIQNLKFEALTKEDHGLAEGIDAALRPRLPTVRSGNLQQRRAAQEYYRWVIARTSEVLLTRKGMTVSGAIRWVVGLDEAEDRRKRAGLTSGVKKARTKSNEPSMEHRARQIYYEEVKPYVWREMVAAGVGRFQVRQTSNDYQIAGYHPREA
jgi:hypothetical protein